jgi:O-antigen ligase
MLLLPLFLMYGRAIADMLIAVIGVCFLAECTLRRDWAWLKAPWAIAGAAWWAWLVVCSLPGIGTGGIMSLGQGLAAGRFLILTAALEHFVLREASIRQYLGRVLAACALWIGGNALVQFATGHNLMGYPRWPGGELTGPFEKPRAGAPLSRLVFPVVLPVISRWINRPGARGFVLAGLLTIVTIATLVLIGQRMPLLLTACGMVAAALMLRRLRGVVIATLVAGSLLLAASAVVSPPSFYRLVTKFTDQMEHWGASPYGLLFGRAVVIAESSPITGRGAFGFRLACNDPSTYVGFSWQGQYAKDGGAAEGCNFHPHNHYMEALTDSGVPGLLLFTGMVLCWMLALTRGLWPNPDPLRVGLFVAALIQEWPISSMESFTAMDSGGWFFLMLGWGLAEARFRKPARSL